MEDARLDCCDGLGSIIMTELLYRLASLYQVRGCSIRVSICLSIEGFL